MRKGPQAATLEPSQKEKDSIQMINWCKTEERLKRLYTPDLGSSQAVSTTRESKQTQGSRKQRESSIKWSTPKDISLPTRERLTKKERHESNQQYPIIASIQWKNNIPCLTIKLSMERTLNKLIFTHPYNIICPTWRRQQRPGQRIPVAEAFFSCLITMSFFNASPQNPNKP